MFNVNFVQETKNVMSHFYELNPCQTVDLKLCHRDMEMMSSVGSRCQSFTAKLETPNVNVWPLLILNTVTTAAK